ncbi:ATP-binding protein [Kitasatospora purpeofusca]|uniref:ATP-binding protein n=1 Tax=Kitasatospora purpeofusca TaxID=67352 RepID=UPI0035DCE306
MTTTATPAPTLTGGRWSLTSATAQTVSALRTTVLDHVRATLESQNRPNGLDDLFDADLITAELLTNAYRHGGRARIDVLVAFPGADLWIGVFDANPRQYPRIDETAPGLASHGQGMRLVDTLTGKRWHTVPLANGKFVTALVPIPEPRHSTGQPASHTPSYDGTAWLTAALPRTARAEAVRRWHQGKTAPLPAGTHFDVVTAEQRRAKPVVDLLRALGIRPGPVLQADGRVVHFLVPPGSTWPALTGTVHHTTGRTILFPRPGTRNWVIPPDGTGNLTDATVLADTFSRTARLPVPTTPPAP